MLGIMKLWYFSGTRRRSGMAVMRGKWNHVEDKGIGRVGELTDGERGPAGRAGR